MTSGDLYADVEMRPSGDKLAFTSIASENTRLYENRTAFLSLPIPSTSEN